MKIVCTDHMHTLGTQPVASCDQSAQRAELRECPALRFLSATAGPQATAEQALIARPRCPGGRSEAMTHLRSDTNQKESHQNRASTTIEGPTPTLVLLDSTPGSPPNRPPPAADAH